jgi:hypothetical protein
MPRRDVVALLPREGACLRLVPLQCGTRKRQVPATAALAYDSCVAASHLHLQRPGLEGQRSCGPQRQCCDHSPSWESPSDETDNTQERRSLGVAGCALRLVAPTDDMAPGGRLRGHAERHRSGPVPSRPSPSGPHHWRADPWFLPWTRIGQTRCRVGTQKYPVLGWALPIAGRSRPRSRAGSPEHQQAKEAEMSVVSFALVLPVVLLFAAMFAYVLARAFLLIGPPGAHRHRPPRGRHP